MHPGQRCEQDDNSELNTFTRRQDPAKCRPASLSLWHCTKRHSNKTKTIRERRQLRRGIVRYVFFRTNKQTTEWSASTARVSAANKKLPGQDHNGGIVSNVKYAVCVTAVGHCVFLLMQWVTVVYSWLLLLLQSVDCVSLRYAAFQNNWSLLYIPAYFIFQNQL